MANIIGRPDEQVLLNKIINSSKAEFLAVCGRRRVGKTFLIKEFFNNDFSFYFSGAENITKKQQLKNFNNALKKYARKSYKTSNTWFDAFENLTDFLERKAKLINGKYLVFIDELPWMDSKKSDFVQALEYFWNTYASSKPNFILIVCGSSTSWIINKIIKNRGGLHNRVTRLISVEPFNLKETEEFLKSKNIIYNRKQMLECYMILGGIPYYLEQLEKDKSLSQNIDYLCFNKNGLLKNEFERVYTSLFKNSEKHLQIIKALAKKQIGLNREQLIEDIKIKDGGSITRILDELEQCGFISTYYAFGNKNKNKIYQVVDFFSLFYLKFMTDNKNTPHFWSKMQDKPAKNAWSGYAFEQLCFFHSHNILVKLGISGMITHICTWRNSEAQIDMLIDRKDDTINLCEIKFSNEIYVITKNYDEDLQNRIAIFKAATQTRKAVHVTFITAYGVKQNEYWSNVQSEVVMDDLFM